MIITGNCLDVMRTFPDNHFNAIVTDPPYGLKFMGKEWDKGVPGVDFWKEGLRICAPGTWLLSFGGTRTYHRMTCSIEDAGWEIRDCIMWLYGSGFPKGKGCLKPAYEPIILARKRGSNPRLNIDECRIGTDLIPNSNDHSSHQRWKEQDGRPSRDITKGEPTWSKGRWPANLILDEEAGEMLDEQSGILKSGSGDRQNKNQDGGFCGGFELNNGERNFLSSIGGASRFFYCAKASSRERNKGLEGLPLFPIRYSDDRPNSHDIFNTEGCGRNTDNKPVKNFHPTVKPLKLMEYLIKLIMPPTGILLDPFAGSGTTLVAAKRLGIESVGIEISEEYSIIARARIEGAA